MAMFHLDYPRNRGYFRWDELGCLARALGFMEDSFESRIPEEILSENSEDITLEVFMNLLNVQKCFNSIVDRTFNIHTDEWNLMVIRRAVYLSEQRVLTFEQLQRVRMAFQVYENADTKGLPLEEKTVLRTLKMCNRMISPLKMMQRVRHMKADFEEEGRIQLHEFFDLILWCDLFSEYVLHEPGLDIKVNEKALYQISDFDTLLSHHDQQIANRLNDEYRRQELTFTKEKIVSKKMPKDIPPVDPEVRKRMVTYHTENYRFLQSEVSVSNRKVYLAKSGHVRGRPITAPDLTLYEAVDPSVRVSTIDARSVTLQDTLADFMRPSTREQSGLLDLSPVRPPDIPQFERSSTTIAVTPQDQAEHLNRIKSLDFDTAVLDFKYLKLLEEKVDEVLPGYREKLANRPVPPTPPRVDTPPPPEEQVMPSEASIHALAYHHYTGPRPSHGRACDARYRGWHKVKTRRGGHHVLAKPGYNLKTSTGQLLNKQNTRIFNESNRDTYIYRYNTSKDTLLEKPLSRAKTFSYDVRKEKSDLEVEPNGQDTGRYSNSVNESKVASDHKSKAPSESSKQSSDVSWRHLRIYQPNVSTARDETSAKRNLENIKEESGRNTRVSQENPAFNMTPVREHTQTSVSTKKTTSSKPSREGVHRGNDVYATSLPELVNVKGKNTQTSKSPQPSGHRKSQSPCLQQSLTKLSNHHKQDRKRMRSFIRLAERVEGLVAPKTFQKLLTAAI